MQEINELKNLVVQSLEAHGVLSQLRAQIRSSVFKIIDMQETQNNKRPNSFFWENPLCQKIYENEHGSLAVELITEMLQFYKMDYTLSVFPHEANLKEEVTREKLSKKLPIPNPEKDVPLFFSVIKAFLSSGGSSFEKKPNQEFQREEFKEEAKIQAKEQPLPKKDFPQKEPEKVEPPKKKDVNPVPKIEPPAPVPKKEPEVLKEFMKEPPIEKKKPENKEVLPELKNKPAQLQPLPPVNTKQPPKQEVFSKEESKASGKTIDLPPPAKESFDINKEKKTLVETQQKMGDFEKKIASKQIAEIPALPIKQEIEKPAAYSVPPGMDRKTHELPEKKNEVSNNYEDEHFDEYNEEVNEEIFHEEENIEEMMYRQAEGQMDPHGQPGLQSSDEAFGASQSQGFDILVNSTTLEEYDYFEDVANP